MNSGVGKWVEVVVESMAVLFVLLSIEPKARSSTQTKSEGGDFGV